MFERYAIFFTPTGALADFGARWLGWDSAAGCAVPMPAFEGLDVAAITKTPRKYGLHGTLKAPFHLDASTSADALHRAAVDFAAVHAPFGIGEMELRHENGFVALRPQGDLVPLRDFATAIVKAFDPFSAPLSAADIARRRKSRLTPRQDQQMLVWGYPFIFEDFHFHLTLSGRLPEATANQVIAALTPEMSRSAETPFRIDAITVMGQDGDGMFHQLHRYALSG
ncbi:DUF1045 domain-containing protein [Sulfitobacter donghicola]|uniref:Xylose isomerase n=1 Tax=Sulfitobacter donghicola DSW-25 = KCTC 12864 = JCM 14565 TaxID=1300350 RepID=A0A073IC39_9RHOB|nr:DUF1045 domain-containing protein [Sulfitobacter donghicola]KEJ87898.1 xylose isomerase [Sulfitobacter donghicola DSW-25 = KCTC 12864 = JCM 14565]KIN67255.1 putative xylose isomerase [Sulfitobacter donghicola DSW-25 = KCTC 12864 = JCM 14565]